MDKKFTPEEITALRENVNAALDIVAKLCAIDKAVAENADLAAIIVENGQLKEELADLKEKYDALQQSQVKINAKRQQDLARIKELERLIPQQMNNSKGGKKKTAK
jgi:regulator of replication initiation timing